MNYLGLVAVFLLAGYVQFNLVVNRSVAAYVMWLAVFSAAIYFYGWYGASAFIANGLIGSRLAFNQLRKSS